MQGTRVWRCLWMSRPQFCIRKGIRGQPKMKSYKIVIAPELRPRVLKELGGVTDKWQPVVNDTSIFINVL